MGAVCRVSGGCGYCMDDGYECHRSIGEDGKCAGERPTADELLNEARDQIARLTAERDAATSALAALQASERQGIARFGELFAGPMECGHPPGCLPEHTAQEAREHPERIVCGWCADKARIADLEQHARFEKEKVDGLRDELAEAHSYGASGFARDVLAMFDGAGFPPGRRDSHGDIEQVGHRIHAMRDALAEARRLAIEDCLAAMPVEPDFNMWAENYRWGIEECLGALRSLLAAPTPGAQATSVEANAVAMGEKPCTHPFRHGIHEWYVQQDGRSYCRACGAYAAPTPGRKG